MLRAERRRRRSAVAKKGEAIMRAFDRMDDEQKIRERGDGPRRRLESVSEYEFEQVVAEVKVKLGIELVLVLLTQAARRWGWPNPPQCRHAAGALFGLALQMTGERMPDS
jgi:hypothetical protein